MKESIRMIALIAGLFSVSLAEAKKPRKPVPVTVVVVDDAGAPVITAVVRHPLEADRHRVHVIDGTWTERVLYLQDGSEFPFVPGTALDFEISAPGYLNQQLQYLVKKRKNRVTVQLEKMEMVDPSEQEEEVFIQFGRDKPIDGESSVPQP